MAERKPPPRPLTAWQAIFAGQIVVNLPILVLFYSVYSLAEPLGYWARLIAAFVVSMAWGLYASRRWQRWAYRRGVDRAQLQRLAGLTLLMMPRAAPREPPAPPRKPKRG
ncbi:MAG: hypothetical protein IT317_05440 [Anaerolineales bacterium]|nr:hypothetical protein [Anaerolineales bacterium]